MSRHRRHHDDFRKVTSCSTGTLAIGGPVFSFAQVILGRTGFYYIKNFLRIVYSTIIFYLRMKFERYVLYFTLLYSTLPAQRLSALLHHCDSCLENEYVSIIVTLYLP